MPNPHRQPPSRPIRRRARGAFTTIELMTALGIMALLLTIFVFAFRHVGGGSQANLTKSQLERLRNALSEITSNKAASDRFFQVQMPAIYRSAQGAGTSTVWYDVSVLPANATFAYENTKRIIAVLQQNDAAKRIIEDAPPANLRRDTVRLVDPAEPPRAVAMPLDAWGNPILFVYDHWMRPNGTNSAVEMLTPTNGKTGGLSGLTYGNGAPADPILRAPDRLPYWFSAGPDGKYETHDDNIYSFEN